MLEITLFSLLFLAKIQPSSASSHQASPLLPLDEEHVTNSSSVDADEVDDERTLLDMFGEAAKEFLTKSVIPPTSADCRWDWRYARCEPYCQCRLQFQWGDYHLGRACRRRAESESETCHVPADSAYAKVWAAGHDAVRVKSQMVLQRMGERWDQVQEQVCESLPEKCFSGERNWKEKLMCRHIPDCEAEQTLEDFENPKMTAFTKGKWSWM